MLRVKVAEYAFRRTPQGVRGLKLQEIFYNLINHASHSAGSAWIETLCLAAVFLRVQVALRRECVD